jgi:hypothetical protein
MRRLALVVSTIVALAPFAPLATPAHAANSGAAVRQKVADRIGDQRRISQGVRAWLNGPNGGASPAAQTVRVSFGTNVDAANPNEDLLAGQSETAIGAEGAKVLASWNDITGFAFNESTQLKASITGVGFSSDGGAHFTDLVGLPNDNPDQQWFGDPTVAAIDSRHFIVGSLYFPSFFTACSDGNPSGLNLAISVGTVNSAGTGVSFSDPIVVANGGNVCAQQTPPGLALLDKEYLAYDSGSRTLVMSYTRFFLGRGHSSLGQIEMVRAHVPATPAQLTTASFGTPIVIWHEEPFCLNGSEANQCGAENEGAYPTVAPGGNAYVAWERNWFSNFAFSGDPYVYIHAAKVNLGAEHPVQGGNARPVIVTEGQRNSNPDGGVKSLDGTVIPGYTRGIGQDFPRVVFDAPLNRLIVVWNDASAHPLGDIWMRPMSERLVHAYPIVRVNSDADYTLHFLPAVSVRSNGTLCTSWYDRRLGGPDSSRTDYFGECRSNPSQQEPDFRITTGSTDWANTGSFINPNFGDYTDNTSTGTTTYFIWSDGRIGVPQPFVDSRG